MIDSTETDGSKPGEQPVPFFYTPTPPQPPPTFSTITRMLCSAAYLNNDFARTVIDEVVGDEQRAVANSVDFDLDPVVRHSFQARKMLFIRDSVLTGLLLVGLITFPFVTLAWILVAAGLLHRSKYRGAPKYTRGPRGTAYFVAAAIVFCCLGIYSPLLLLFASLAPENNDPTGLAGDDPLSGALPVIDAFFTFALALPLTFAIGTLAALAVHRMMAFRAILQAFGADVPGSAPQLPNERIAQRLHWVRGTQNGNVTVHARNPLLGAGAAVGNASWTMALSLRTDPTLLPPTDSTPQPRVSVHDSVDPYEIHVAIRKRVWALTDPALPEHQRVPGVRVADHIVADGERREGDPLLDPARRPHSVASPEAIAAIIRHPQGGLRYYQRITIGVEGKPVVAGDGRLVLPAQNQEVVISAFVHVAVEGGRLYAEFLGMMLPPILEEYHVADRLRKSAALRLGEAVSSAVRLWPETIKAPLHAARSLWQIMTLSNRMDRAREDSQQNLIHDYGARISVRELASEETPQKFLQSLDAEKYLKLVEKAVSEALIDYLEEHHVDTSEYRTRMTYIQNNSTTISESTFVNSAVAVGSHSSASN